MISNLKNKTALSNTRSKPHNYLSVHIDYLRIRANSLTESEVQNAITFCVPQNELLTDSNKQFQIGSLKYRYSFRNVGGNFKGGFDYDDDGIYSLLLEFSGGYFENLTTEQEIRLLNYLSALNKVRCLRFDGAIDTNRENLINIEDYKQAIVSGNFMYGTSWRLICNSKYKETLYLGSRESEKMLRIYQHDDVRRYEIEFKGKRSRNVFDVVSNIRLDRPSVINNEESVEQVENEYKIVLGRLILGAFDFVDRSGDKKHVEMHDRLERLQFHQNLVDAIGQPLSMKVLREKPTLERTERWIEKQVIMVLSVLKRLHGCNWGDYFNAWMQRAADRWSDKYSALLACFTRELEMLTQ